MNVNNDLQSEFRNLSEFNINNFLIKLKIVENTPIKSKNQNKTSMAKAMDPSEMNRPLGSPDPVPMYRLNLILIAPVSNCCTLMLLNYTTQ